MQEEKIGRMERLQPNLYSGRINCSFSIYELGTLRNAIASSRESLQTTIDRCTEDWMKYDLMEMKLKQAELSDRINDMILAATKPIED